MMGKKVMVVAALLGPILTLSPRVARAQTPETNPVVGEVDLVGKTNTDKTSGVWVDGLYIGYVGELNGGKKILLLPGEHKFSIRQAGYISQEQTVTVEPGKVETMNVDMQPDPKAIFPTGETAEVKLKVTPDRAAVFLDGAYAGTTHEFGGIARSMIVSPGKHRVKIALAGYKEFDTEIDVRAGQKITIKTDLEHGSITQAGPAIKSDKNENSK